MPAKAIKRIQGAKCYGKLKTYSRSKELLLTVPGKNCGISGSIPGEGGQSGHHHIPLGSHSQGTTITANGSE
jgi:hypothetical protein